MHMTCGDYVSTGLEFGGLRELFHIVVFNAFNRGKGKPKAIVETIMVTFTRTA